MADGLSLPAATGRLTGDDIIRAGACAGGVGRRLQALARSGQIAAAEPPDRLLTLVPKEERQYIESALILTSTPGERSEHGYGYGDGYGYGYGDGDGDGDADGDGYGYGYGYGYGDGYGDGDGYGYGYGSGGGRSYG